MNVVLLGGGRIGQAIAKDLASDPRFHVTVVDRSQDALSRVAASAGCATRQADLSDPATVRQVVQGQDLVVEALPGFLGFRTLQAILEAGKPVVDIAFFPEDPFSLDGLARTQGLVAVVDAGVAPGLSNLLLGHHEATMERVLRFECLVGGLPVIRHWPFQYKAPFSPADVVEEYTRPARVRRNGRLVLLPALSELETLDFPEVGALEAFLTDGLRTLLRTSKVPDMVEKTLRYPGHAEWMKGLRHLGFFEAKPLKVGSVEVAPRELTVRLLERVWAFDEGEEDLTVMRIQIEGQEGGKRLLHSYFLLDRYDSESRVSSMARTTGYTAAAVVRLLGEGRYREPGITPLELVGRDPEAFGFLLDELAARGIRFRHEVREVEE